MRRRDMIAAMAAAALIPLSHARAAEQPSTPKPPRRLFQAGDQAVALGQFDEFGPGAFLFDYARNRVHQTQFAAGGRIEILSTLAGPGSPIADAVCNNNTLAIANTKLAEVAIERTPFTAANGPVTISAEIAKRRDRQPAGTILLVAGSGPAAKQGLDFWALHFLARGWAVVTYDKRGCGTSTGNWLSSGLEDLSADARAVIAACPAAPRPFGAWGISQAGWILPQLAAQRAIDFIVMHAGAATTPGEQMLDAVEFELIAYDMPRPEIDKALAYYRLDNDVSRGRARWTAIDKAYKDASAAKAEWLLGPPAPADAPFRTLIRLIADFDPAPYWRQTSIPVIALFGGKDVIVPPARNRDRLRALAPPSTPFTDAVLDTANHIFTIADKGVRREYPKCTAIHPAYFPTVDDWLQRRAPR